MLTPRFTANAPRMIPYRMKRRSGQNTAYWFDLRIAQDKSFFTNRGAMRFLFCHTMSTESLVKVVKRNKDDSHGEILEQKNDQIGEEVRYRRLKDSPYAAQRSVGNHQRSDKTILKITPRIDQIIHGIPTFQVEQGSTRIDIIEHLTRQLLQSSNKEKLIEELSPQDGSEETTSIIVEQGNIQAFELMEFTQFNAKYTSLGHIHCYCGSILSGASEAVQQQIIENVIQNFELMTMSAFKIKKKMSRGNNYHLI